MPSQRNGARRSRDSAAAGGREAPPAMTRAAPTTGMATSEPRIGGLAVEGHGRVGDGHQTQPGERGGQGAGQPQEPGRVDRHQGAQRQLPGPGERGEVGGRRIGGRLDHGHRERGDDDAGQGDRQPDGQRPSGAECADGQEDRGIDQVELLLDGQRPEVEEGGGRLVGRQVVGADRGEVEVGQEDRRPSGVDGCLVAEHRADHGVGRDDGDDDDQGGGRDDPAAPPSVEVEQRRAPGCVPLPEEDSGDDEPRDDEEHIDADVAATQAGEAAVIQHDQGDSDGPEAFDVGAEPTVPGGGPRFVGQTGQPTSSESGGAGTVTAPPPAEFGSELTAKGAQPSRLTPTLPPCSPRRPPVMPGVPEPSAGVRPCSSHRTGTPDPKASGESARSLAG